MSLAFLRGNNKPLPALRGYGKTLKKIRRLVEAAGIEPAGVGFHW
jgi:hypothetical protein